MADYLPAKDLQLQQWLANFVLVATLNETALGLTTADITPISTDQGFFQSAMTQITNTKTAFEGAVKSKAVIHKTLVKDVRALVKKIQSNPNVTVVLKSQLGINATGGTRTKTPPVTPTTLVATPQAIGINTIAWKKAGNKTTTQYVVYAKPLTAGAKVSDASGWIMVGQTTRSKFDHIGVTPGQPVAYKVAAARADQTSLPSVPVTVYTS